MNGLFDAAIEIEEFMTKQQWSFCFIGGLAVLRWGEIRMTQDIDLCLLSGYGNEKKYIEIMLKNFQPRISDANAFAFKNRVLLLQAKNNVAIDVTLSGISFEEKMIQQATQFQFSPECLLTTCSAENLIILKAFADRPQDWLDVEGILAKQKDNLDVNFILREFEPLCNAKESPEIIEKLKELIGRMI